MSAQNTKIIGSIIGLAVGDALGAPIEGMKAGHIQQVVGEVNDYIDSRTVWPERPSHWRMKGLYTDDTQQALALTDILGDYGFIDPEALADLWTRLLHAQTGASHGAHRGIGRNFLSAVRAMGSCDSPLDAGRASAGSGAAMRIAPVGIYFHDNDNEDSLLDAVSTVSLMTHSDPRGIAGAAAIAYGIAKLLNTPSRIKQDEVAEIANEIKEFTRRAEEFLQDIHFNRLDKETRLKYAYFMSDALEILPAIVREANHDLARSTIVKEANRLEPTDKVTDIGVGFAPASITGALYYALTAKSFFHGMVDTVNAGRDTDTMGAMVGALMGARFGFDAIPEEWTAGLVNFEQVRLRGEYLANREVDYMTREDYVEMETRLTQDEVRYLESDLKKFFAMQETIASKKPKTKSKPDKQPVNIEDLGFAPPPEVWLERDDLAPDERRREKERRARRRIDWKETRREKKRMRPKKENE
jgi:ADP-ribosyl-[dinitrogen reductase] hydrolase